MFVLFILYYLHHVNLFPTVIHLAGLLGMELITTTPPHNFWEFNQLFRMVSGFPYVLQVDNCLG